MRGMILGSALLLAAANPAIAVTDPATGLAVDPPAPFVATMAPPVQNAAAAMVITSTTGTPVAVLGDPTVCSVAFRVAPSNANLTQVQLNEFLAKPEMINLTKASLELLFELGEGTLFTVGDVAGLEFDGRMKAGAAPAGVLVYIASMQTPKGVTLLTCFASQADFPRALPQFRGIRDTITPPK